MNNNTDKDSNFNENEFEYQIKESEGYKIETLNLHFNSRKSLNEWLKKDNKNESCGNYVYLIEEQGDKDMISFCHYKDIDTFFPTPFCALNYGNGNFNTDYPQVIWSEFASNGITLIERYDERSAIIKLMKLVGFNKKGNFNYSNIND